MASEPAPDLSLFLDAQPRAMGTETAQFRQAARAAARREADRS